MKISVWLDSIPLVSYVKWEVESSGASARASQTDLKLLVNVRNLFVCNVEECSVARLLS